MRGSSLNILRNALKPGCIGTMAHKLMLRADSLMRRSDLPSIKAWCELHREDASQYAGGIDAELWSEANAFGEELEAHGRQTLDSLGVHMGGGGHHPLLYFFVRRQRPKVAVETGVAAGFSSAAILTAMEKNGSGRLYSSDFPYFRLDGPERYIGCVVDKRLRSRWELRVKGDRKNLPAILEVVSAIELVHYDSDKSYPGRRWAFQKLMPRLAANAVVIMDDIQDDWFFRDHVEKHQLKFKVFGFQGKYLGLIT